MLLTNGEGQIERLDIERLDLEAPHEDDLRKDELEPPFE